MSKLSVGIVGMPNVGKSTLFNALLKKQLAYAANFPFATIEPNVGVVPVPDSRLKDLQQVIETEIATSSATPRNDSVPIIPATVEFVDIAGLIAGAHKGEGLGNKFLHHIREVDAICHVVRVFENENILKHETAKDPITDFETIRTELALADLATLEKQKAPKGMASREDTERWNAVQKIVLLVQEGKSAYEAALTEEELRQAKMLSLLTLKPIIVALNISEEELVNASKIEEEYAQKLGVQVNQVVAICAKVEEELAGLEEAEAFEYLKDLGVEKTGLERLIKKAFATLGLITFLTAGEKEVRAWTIKENTLAPQAAGTIHNDFEKKFIKADVVDLGDFLELGGWKNAREKGKVRQEGRDYEMQDGDVVEFKIGA